MSSKVSTFFRRHKVALYGVLAGTLILTVAQSVSGSGDFTFQQSSSNGIGGAVIALDLERKADLLLPNNYNDQEPVPLLINLHGYTGSGPSHSAYTFLQEAALQKGLAYIAPTGSEDSLGNTYWNATTACCDFNKSGVDDVAYIDELIAKASAAAKIDANRIYLFGHSNGHFMSYAYLCSGSTKVAAVAGLAGAMETDTSLCMSEPANVLHIHGEKDETILYGGGALFGNAYSSAESTVSQWSAINQCNTGAEAPFDLLASISGKDANAQSFTCRKGSLDFWHLPSGTHTPALDIGFANKVLDWLLASTKS